MTTEFHPLALQDLDEAMAFYEDQQRGLGLQLLLEVQAALLLVQAFPHAWPEFSLHTRQAVLRRFPYSLILRIETHRLRIVAVAHHKRRPDSWHERH